MTHLKANLICTCMLLTVSSAYCSAAPQNKIAIKAVTIVADSAVGAPARHGIAKLEEALRGRGITVAESATPGSGTDFVILVGVANNQGAATQTIVKAKAPLPQGTESLTTLTGTTYQGKPAIVLEGGDSVGLMYAALDVADRIAWTSSGEDPFRFVRTVSEKPYLKDRGVVAFTMNRAYFESHLHDERFWTEYFDMMAQDRINQFVLTFGYENGGYMAPMYPYFFNVDGFPDVKVVGLTPEEQRANLAGLKTMLQLATERGIQVKPGIWDHIYRGGVQRGGMSWAPDGKTPGPGVVTGLNSDNVARYTAAALKKFYETFPEIRITQFRMHNESGLLDPEIDGFWHDIFSFYSKEKPDEMLELRIKGLDKSVVKDAQSQGLKIQLDTKIWMEQMGLPYHSTHINREDQSNSRQSYADFLQYPQTYNMNWSLWNGGTQRVLEWVDPAYAKRMTESARLYDGPGLAVTEMEATKMLGDAPDVAPRDFLNPKYKYTTYEFERYWAFYRVWGRIAYDPSTPTDFLENEYVHRFGAQAGPHVLKALELSSQVLPRVIAASVPYRIFPTTVGWVEMQHLGSLPQFAQQEEGSDIAQFMNLKEEATSIIQGTDSAMRRPEETSRWFAQKSAEILQEVAAAEKAMGDRAPNNEFKATLTDAKILAAMARYHSWRQLAGVDYNLYKQAGSLPAFDEAIANEKKAIASWREMVDAAGDFYIDNMTFGPSTKNFPSHWKDELPKMDKEFNDLLAEREAAKAKPGGSSIVIPTRTEDKPAPVVSFVTAKDAKATPAKDFLVETTVKSTSGVKWIRLWYRHLNQEEDYQTVDMKTDPKSGHYVASVPGSFITPRWDLMYYVEVVDNNGQGRIYPDLERETPYVVVSVRR